MIFYTALFLICLFAVNAVYVAAALFTADLFVKVIIDKVKTEIAWRASRRAADEEYEKLHAEIERKFAR